MFWDQLYFTSLNLSSIYLYDYILCKIFTKKARWYQLHFVINTITVINILPYVINIINDPNNYYEKIDSTNLTMYLSNYHLCLHFYHIIMFNNLNFWDYFHHIIFAFLGIIPGMIFIKSNQLYFQKISCAGLPGMIEYGSLVLFKHDKMSKYRQKRLNTILYIFFRLPLCIFGATYNLLAYKNNLIEDPLWITLYVNLMLYFNGTLFTYLTGHSFYKLKYSNKLE
jgi:hypothetical protein